MGLQKLTPATEEEILTSPEFAPFREMLRRKRALIEAMPLAGVPKDAAYPDAAKTETAVTSPTGGLGGGTTVVDDDNEGQDEGTLPVGGLTYADAQREAAAANQGLYSQIQSNIDVLDAAREALRNRRLAPSKSEKWLAIAAALGQPTRTGAFGESLGNLAQALGAQKAERRKFEQEAEMLGLKYGLEAGTERMRLAQARATEADRTLRAASTAAAKAEAAKRPKYRLTSNDEWVIEPGTGGMPNTNTKGQYVVRNLAEANLVPRGQEFVYENDPTGKVRYGQ